MIMTYHQIYSSAKTVTLIESSLVKYAKIFTSVIYISIIYANKMDLNFCIRYRFWKKLVSNISLYLSTSLLQLFCNIIRQFFLKRLCYRYDVYCIFHYVKLHISMHFYMKYTIPNHVLCIIWNCWRFNICLIYISEWKQTSGCHQMCFKKFLE